ncbi:MAG: sigma-70 family RNA polymerase sigma factor [Oscillospiraceae bacterium]|nr:sigma-70 family RNA polymerase sigma factor [Oscillospiraceae bacterium]
MVVDVIKVEAARKGDRQSFAQVYESIAPDLYKIALYMLGNSHDAEDAVSEAFIEAWKGIANLRDAGSFKPWMMKILAIRCKRRIADYVKHKNTFDIDSFVVSLSDDADLSSDVSEQVTVLGALSRLSPQEREIIALSAVQGYTTKEIAAILQSPQGTVSSKLHRALAKLRKMLGEEDGAEQKVR